MHPSGVATSHPVTASVSFFSIRRRHTRWKRDWSSDVCSSDLLITRDAFDLAASLQPLLGGLFSNIIFGIGVLGMALSSISLMMVISGLVLCELVEESYSDRYFRIGILFPSIAVLGIFFWDQALFWLAIPTSVITLLILPLAYVAFLLMLNNKAIMGEHMPRGGRRVAWNVLMVLSILLIGATSFYMLWN